MLYIAEIQTGYYEDDDTYHGPFCDIAEIYASSIHEALVQAKVFLQTKLEQLGEPIPDGTILRLNDELGELVYDYRLGNVNLIFQTNEVPREMLEVCDSISSELITFLKHHPNEMYSLRPRQFEKLIAEILTHYGWIVQLTPATRDGGYDIFAICKDISGVSNSWIIECKKYEKERKVGVDIVRALYGAAGGLQCANAAIMLATTATFTKNAMKYASSKYNFELRDYESVIKWINAYKPHNSGKLYYSEEQ
jgi:HJR/Mrr/RecB family endonuclease